MATIAGTIQLPDGSPYVGKIRFFRCDAPAVVGPALVTGIHDGLVVETEEDGEFATELKAGTYRMQIAGSRAWTIHVLDDTATYDIRELGVPGFPSYAGTGSGGVTVQPVDKAVQGAAGLRAVVVHQDDQVRTLEYLTFPGDRQGGDFIYDAASTWPDDSVDVIRPFDVSASSPGRWHRDANL